MKTLNYSIRINVPKAKVWETMLAADSYKEWAKAFSAESGYKGEWKQGATMTFSDPNLGGTKALLEVVKPFENIKARHTAIVNLDGSEDTESDTARNWIGATEAYDFSEQNGVTKLDIAISTHEDFERMFNDCWPKALELLKNLCEK